VCVLAHGTEKVLGVLEVILCGNGVAAQRFGAGQR
jgi:hypothetical protein